MVDSLKVNQWKNTDSVINWFNAIENKPQCVLIQLGITEFYPTITEQILDDSINFAKQHTGVTDENLRIIKYYRKSLLFNNNESWKKRNTGSCLGIYLLSLLAKYIDKNDSGSYRDDGLTCYVMLINEK